MKPARVVGAGLSGLTAAWCLAEAGFDVTVQDLAEGPGGLIATLRTPEGLVERAANAFVWNETVERWFQRLGITAQFPQPVAKRRFIFRNGKTRRWPLSARETAATVARAGMTFVQRGFAARDHESVADWGRRTVGPAATSWLLAPAMQGVYASTASELAARAIFGDRRGKVVSAAPPGGMGEFIERLHAQLIRRGVSFRFGDGAIAIEPGVPTVVATNARAAVPLVAPYAPALGRAIAAVPMNAILTVTTFFAPHPSDVHGFGVLFPRATGVGALGVLFNADIFPGRSTLRSETWIYGSAGQPPGLPADADIAAQISRDREILTGRGESPAAIYATRREPALPVYNDAVLAVRERLADLPPWLGLAGNFVGRLGVATLLEVAEGAAQRVKESGN
jgi:oxygen-dependent protoporphyrinogen oxidase